MTKQTPYLATLLLFSITALPALADETKTPRTLQITGKGESIAAPDEANVSLSIVTQAPTAALSTTQNAQKASEVFKRLKEKGLSDKDISTLSYSVQPQYTYEKNNAPKLMAYQTQNTLNVRISDIKNVGSVLDALLAEDGANRVQGISFGRKDLSAQMNEARTKAMQDALSKAKLYAEQAGAKLGEVLTISEQEIHTTPQPRVLHMQAMEARSNAAPTPISAGDLTWSAQVHVTFALK